MWKIEVRTPSIARVIIAGKWDGNPEKANRLLEDICDICENWPEDRRVKFLITCGGFIQFGWPEKDSVSVDDLVKAAEDCVNNSVLSGDLNERLVKFTEYITLGIDSCKRNGNVNQPHIELVFLRDLRQGKFYWTGKSYPTSAQQNSLARIADLETHFIEIEEGKVMILVCHDLNIFNPRSKNATGWRRNVKNAFIRLAKRMEPKYVLHHPHTTVKVRTWLNAWNRLREMLRSSVKVYAGAGRFYEPDREPSEYDPLEDVLESTKCGNTIDFIVFT